MCVIFADVNYQLSSIEALVLLNIEVVFIGLS